MNRLAEQYFALSYDKMKELETRPRALPAPGSDYVKCRLPLVAWIIEVCDAFKLANTTASHACYLMDRLFASQKLNQKSARDVYQLVAMLSILLAAKFDETARSAPTMAELNEMSEGAYSTELFRATELSALEFLEWSVIVITPMSYLRHFMNASLTQDDDLDGELSKVVVLLAGLALQEFSFAFFPPSLVCATIVCCGRMLVKEKLGSSIEVWPGHLEALTKYSKDDLSKCLRRMMNRYERFFGGVKGVLECATSA